MAASVPQLDDHLPELLEFARTVAQQIEMEPRTITSPRP
jgi:hypothetical protein